MSLTLSSALLCARCHETSNVRHGLCDNAMIYVVDRVMNRDELTSLIDGARNMYHRRLCGSMMRMLIVPSVQKELSHAGIQFHPTCAVNGRTPRKTTPVKHGRITVTPHKRLTINDATGTPFSVIETDFAMRENTDVSSTAWITEDGLICQRVCVELYAELIAQLCREISTMLCIYGTAAQPDLERFVDICQTIQAFTNMHSSNSLVIYVVTTAPASNDTRIQGILIGQQGTRTHTPWFSESVLQSLNADYADGAWVHLLCRAHWTTKGTGRRMLTHFCQAHPLVVLEPFIWHKGSDAHMKNERLVRFYQQSGFVTSPSLLSNGLHMVHRHRWEDLID